MENEIIEKQARNDYGSITRIAACMYKIASDHGFHENDGEELSTGRLGEFIANLHGECSELWESARKGTLAQPCDKHIDLSNAEEELADIVIRAMDMAHAMGINLGAAIAEKADYNRQRPYKHGKKC